METIKADKEVIEAQGKIMRAGMEEMKTQMALFQMNEQNEEQEDEAENEWQVAL